MIALAASLATVPGLASTTSWDGRLSTVSCDQLPGQFTLGENQRVPDSELESLCGCITERVGRGGWEIEELRKWEKGSGENKLLRGAAIKRFGDAVQYCSSGKFFENVGTTTPVSTNEDAKSNDQVSANTQRILGFVGGGPLGMVLAPTVYQWVSGNLIAWLVIGVVAGGIFWNIQIGLAVMIFGAISKFVSGK